MQRRQFLKRVGALGATAAAPGLGLGLGSAHAQADDYKALVVLFLEGGNDAANTIVPIDATEYRGYADIRGDLALARGELVPLATAGGASFGLHPKLAPLEPIWSAGKLAVAFNVGPLVRPNLRRADYQRDPTLLPLGHFAHDAQSIVWQSADPQGSLRTGWGGRLLDRTLALNGDSVAPPAISVHGYDALLQGDATGGFIVPLWERFGLDAIAARPAVEAARRDAFAAMLGASAETTLTDAVARRTDGALRGAASLNSVLAGRSEAVDRHFAGLDGSLPLQMYRIARLIEKRRELGLRRQVFAASIGTFDTHGPQQAQHAGLLEAVGVSMRAFFAATGALGVADDVTLVTISEFGRSLRTNGQGTEHGWGGHAFVMGGAVRGGRTYGTCPGMGFGTPEDFDGDGRWIPTLSIEQTMASIALWFGVAPGDLGSVFPNAGRFDLNAVRFFG